MQASYDFENHLVQLGTRDYTAYSYDADGNRLSVSTRLWAPGTAPTGAVAGTTTVYLVDPLASFARVVLESSGGYYATRYEYGEDLLRMVGTSGTSSYYLYDGLGSTRQLTDANGAVTDGYLYDAYGVGLARTGSTANSFLFQGQQYDAASGTYYLRARYYDQSSGRFLSQDPFGGSNNDPISLHRYLYADDDPTDLTDPSGEDPNFSLGGISTTLASVASFGAQNFSTILGAGLFVYGMFDPDGAVGLGETLPQAGSGGEAGAEVGLVTRGFFSKSGKAIRGALSRIADELSEFDGAPRGWGGAKVKPEDIFKAEQKLKSGGITLVKNADAELNAAGMGAGFDGPGKRLLLRSNATRLQLFHEMQHFQHYLELGADVYNDLSITSKLDKEEYVFNKIMANANKFNERELKTAQSYIQDFRDGKRG